MHRRLAAVIAVFAFALIATAAPAWAIALGGAAAAPAGLATTTGDAGVHVHDVVTGRAGRMSTGALPAEPRAVGAGSGPGFGTYRWPVHGEVIRPYEPPPNPYSAGHRGIDIAAPFGTPIRAPADGTVSFAGPVAGSLFISIDHAGGIRTSYSWVSSIGVKKGQAIKAGALIGATGQGHPGSDQTHLHFSARLNGDYIDPMLLLGGGNLDDLIRLAA